MGEAMAEAEDKFNMKREMIHTVNLWLKKLSRRARSAMVPLALLAMWATTGAFPTLAQQPAQPMFASAAAAHLSAPTPSLFHRASSSPSL